MLAYVLTLSPTVVISVKSEQFTPLHRSILKPSSLSALSVHDRLMREFEATVAETEERLAPDRIRI